MNSSHFFEKQSNSDMDRIALKISTFDADPNDLTDTKGVPEYFQLLPCEDLSIAVNLQRIKLINRADSPCRNDYPPGLKMLVPTPIKPVNLYNAMLASELPYDQRTCEEMCVVSYWLPLCSCMMSYDIWHYAGGIENDSVARCPFESEDEANQCTMTDVYSRTPAEEFDRCECFRRCVGYEFTVSAYDKVRHRPGEQTSL